MKSLTKLSILAGTILLISVAVNAVSITWGHHDTLLATEHVFKPSSLNTKQTVEVIYPAEGQINFVNLTAVKIYDLTKEFGAVYLRKGGPGYTYSNILLESPIGKALNYTVEYYG